MRPISTSTITINNLSVVAKGRVDYSLRPTSTSSIIAPTVTSYIAMKTIIEMMIFNRYMQKYTMLTWFMGVIVAGIVPISNSPINVNSLLHTERGRVSGLFRHISTSDIINTYITPIVTIITTYIFPPFTIIATDIDPLGVMITIYYYLIDMNIFSNKTSRKL